MKDFIWLERIKAELKRDILKEDKKYVAETLNDHFDEIQDELTLVKNKDGKDLYSKLEIIFDKLSKIENHYPEVFSRPMSEMLKKICRAQSCIKDILQEIDDNNT